MWRRLADKASNQSLGGSRPARSRTLLPTKLGIRRRRQPSWDGPEGGALVLFNGILDL